MFGLQPTHLILIIIVALIIFGPQRLPEIGRALGRSINEFKAGTREMTDAFNSEVTRSGETIRTDNHAKPEPVEETKL